MPAIKGGISRKNHDQKSRNEKSGKYRRQYDRTRKNKVRRITRMIATAPESYKKFLQERISYWKEVKTKIPR